MNALDVPPSPPSSPPAPPAQVSRHRSKIALALWALVALVAVVQVGRLGLHVFEPESSDWFLSTRHPFWAQHECLPAYIFAAELHARGEENVYDSAHYPGLNREAEPATEIRGLDPEDPFQYPPQFLLLPTLAISLTQSYPLIRVSFFLLQLALLVAVGLALARWIGGREGRLAAWLFPLAVASFPMLHALQYGQFHLAAVVLGVAGLLAFERGWSPLGGLCLATAILAKVFPGVLLVYLLGRRRWRDVAWTLIAGLVLTGLSLGILGPAPFVAFFDHQLPRLADGRAFAFGEAWPEVADLLVAANQGVHGLVAKLEFLGVAGIAGEGASRLARFANGLFGILTLVTAFSVGRATAVGSRHRQAVAWLALLGLGSLGSAGAFADYVPLTATWLLTVAAPAVRWRSKTGIFLGTAWVFQFFLLGATPIGTWAPPEIMIPLSAVGSILLFGLFGWGAIRPLRREAGEVPGLLRRQLSTG